MSISNMRNVFDLMIQIPSEQQQNSRIFLCFSFLQKVCLEISQLVTIIYNRDNSVYSINLSRQVLLFETCIL